MSTPQRYNLAWNYIWESYSSWKKDVITNDPDGRQGKEFSKEFGRACAALAESNDEIPVIKSNYKINEPAVSGSK